MRRLSWLIVGLFLSWLGASMVAGAETFAPYLLRDALLLGLAGAGVFAFNAAGWLAIPVLRRPRGLQRTGWLLLLTGLAVTLGGGLALALGLAGIAGLSAGIAWGLGLALQLIGAWWPGAASDYALPSTRWGRDAAGNIVVVPTGEDGAPARRAPGWSLAARPAALWLLAVLALAAFLRFWNLEQLPPACIGSECAQALQLLDPGAEPAGMGAARDGLALDLRLAALLAQWTQSGLLGLRLASALIAFLTVVFAALALRRLASPVPALVGAALLALSPWHLLAGRSSDPFLAAACLAALALWLGLEALARNHARWWLPWGIAAGLLAAQTPVLWPGAALWAIVVAGLGLAQGRRQRGRVGAADYWRWPLCGLAAAVGASLGAYLGAAPPQWSAVWSQAGWSAAGRDGVALLAALLRPEAAGAAPILGGLLGAFNFALALAGAGVLLRHLRQPPAGMVLAGAAALGGAALVAAAAAPDEAATAPAAALLPLLPLLVALATVAMERLLAALVVTWGPPLLRTSTVLGAAALLLVLLAGRGAFVLLWEIDNVRSGGAAEAETGMARYIAAQVAAPEGQTVTFVVPRQVIEMSSLRLLAGDAVEAGRVRALALSRTLPFAERPAGDVVYLLPLLDNQVLDLLRQLYPSGEATVEWDAAGERALFHRYRVAQPDLLRSQALSMFAAPADLGAEGGAAVGGDAAAGIVSGIGQEQAVVALDFAWRTAPPFDLPFTAQWRGSLIVPESGRYTFAVENGAPESTFTLILDDILLLDSSLRLVEQQVPLPRGIHRLHVDYRSGSQPGDLRVTWQAEGQAVQVLAAPLLHSPTLPDQGLLGDYYGNDRFEGPLVAEHKDPLIGLDPGLPLPYSVDWHGLLAAPRAGEYLIGVDAPGAAQVMVAGALLADNNLAAAVGAADAAAEKPSSYSEGLVYLAAGWHPITVRFAAAAEPGLGDVDRVRLLWQPPGGDPAELASRYLLPAYGLTGPADVALPALPPVTDPLLGDERFALSRPAATSQSHATAPPAALPPLALERLGAAGGVCGDAAGQLNAPHGAVFAADGSRLYVADTGNRRLQVFDAAGLPLQTINSDLFQEPVDVALAADGSLLVLDALAQQVFRVDEDGGVELTPLQASFYRPRGLAVDAAGNIVVADTGGARVVVMGPDGAPLVEFGGQGSPLGRGQPVDALPGAGALWAISAEDGRLWNLTSDGSLTAIQPSGTVDGPQLAQLSGGRLLASDPARATFTLFSPAGEPLAQFGYVGELQQPTGVAAAPGAEGDVIAVVDTRACAVSFWRLGE